MRREIIPATAIPLLLCLAVLFVSPTLKAPSCKEKTDQCCVKKQARPVNHEMIMESLPRQFIILVR